MKRSDESQYIKKYIRNKYTEKISASGEINSKQSSGPFIRYPIPDFPISIMMPASITIMDPCSVKAKYPFENRPDLILTIATDETVNFLFSHTQSTVTDEELANVVEGLLTVIKRMNPGSHSAKANFIQCEISSIGWFDYTSAALDQDIYNIMYVLKAQEKLLLGGFCCLPEVQQEWQPIVLQMIKTIQYQEADHHE